MRTMEIVSLYTIEAVSSLQECDDMLKCLLYFLVLPDNILSFLNIFSKIREEADE